MKTKEVLDEVKEPLELCFFINLDSQKAHIAELIEKIEVDPTPATTNIWSQFNVYDLDHVYSGFDKVNANKDLYRHPFKLLTESEYEMEDSVKERRERRRSTNRKDGNERDAPKKKRKLNESNRSKETENNNDSGKSAAGKRRTLILIKKKDYEVIFDEAINVFQLKEMEGVEYVSNGGDLLYLIWEKYLEILEERLDDSVEKTDIFFVC